MTKNNRCCVGGCDNDQRYPERVVKRSHVSKMVWHLWPKDKALSEPWKKRLAKGRENFEPGLYMSVCSNHFVDGKRTASNPVPMLFMTAFEQQTPSPKKRRKVARVDVYNIPSTTCASLSAEWPANVDEIAQDNSVYPSMKFEQITRESDVRFFTGLRTMTVFKFIFDWLLFKAVHMQYWRGAKTTSEFEAKRHELQEKSPVILNKPGPSRSLTHEQEFLLVLMRLRLGLLGHDLAFRFKVTTALVSSIFITWLNLMAKELGVLIVWPSRGEVKKTLPNCFKKLYPEVRCIILLRCFEVFTETPSALDIAAAFWSEYKHYYTFKLLIAITPTGAISYVSPAYGGRTSDVFVVRDSGFLNFIEPFDQVMADRGFKIKENLLMIMATLCIPLSCAASTQMIASDVRKISSIANVRSSWEICRRCAKILLAAEHKM